MSVTRPRDRQDRPDRGTVDAARDADRDARDAPTCAACRCYVNPRKAVRGAYCSADCYYREKGRKALKNLEKDHRYCRTCFAKVKDLEKPDDDAPDFVVGYQYGTAAATDACREYDSDSENLRPLVKERLGCRCGTTDLRDFDETLATTDLQTTLINLVAALRQKHREDKVPRLDYRRLWDAYGDTADLEYSVGVALYE